MGILDFFSKKNTENSTRDYQELFQAAETITQQFAATVVKNNGQLTSEKYLPHPKEKIKHAFQLMIAYCKHENDKEYEEILRANYLLISTFQEMSDEEERLIKHLYSTVNNIANIDDEDFDRMANLFAILSKRSLKEMNEHLTELEERTT